MPATESDAKRLVYYSAMRVTRHLELPGMKRFNDLFALVNVNTSLVDRSGALTLPVRTKVLDPIPQFRRSTKTYDQICNERAVELLAHADALDVPIYVFYSGGIDSTLIVVSLLKNASARQRERITLLLTGDSIRENPRFFREHISKLQLDLKPAIVFPVLFSKRAIFVLGEPNDQLFGSDLLRDVAHRIGEHVIGAKYDRDTMIEYWRRRTKGTKDAATLDFYAGVFDALIAKAAATGCALATTADVLWWFNFTMRWQVATGFLGFAAKIQRREIDKDFYERHFFPFFDTEDFQLWSMNNLEAKIAGTWKSYKQVARDAIYDFTKDADYRDHKKKMGSFFYVIVCQQQMPFITEEFTMHSSLEPEAWYEPDNSFR